MSTNTGGAAFPLPDRYAAEGMTMRQWYAGMALQGLCANPELAFVGGLSECAFIHADSMILREKEENLPTERISIGSDDQRKALEAFKLIENIDHPEFDGIRLSIANLASRFVVSGEAVVKESSTTDHSEDSLEKVAKLEAANRELVEFVERLAAFPLEEFGWQSRKDSQPLHGWNDYTLYVSDIKRARNLVAKHKEVA